MACNLRKAGLFPLEKSRRKPRKVLSKIKQVQSNIEKLTNDKNYEDSKEWLRLYEKPWQTVELKWRDTSRLRIRSFTTTGVTFQDILADWPAYKNQYGDRLVILVYFILLHD